MQRPLLQDALQAPLLSWPSCARHDTERARGRFPRQVIAEPKATRRARASP